MVRASAAQRRLKRWCFINIILRLKPKHSTVPATRHDFNSIPDKTMTDGSSSWLKRLLLLPELSVGQVLIWCLPLFLLVLGLRFQAHTESHAFSQRGRSREEAGESRGQSPCRFLVKACSFYSTHGVAKATCLLACNGKPLLIKENNQRA